ncbi:MAG: MFS transporter [Alphaproteobacteria bacterium]
MNRLKLNVALLAACQAFNRMGSSMMVTTGAIVGAQLSGDVSYATIPIALMFVAQTLAAFPSSMAMKRLGRKVGFIGACLIGTAGASVCAWAIIVNSFWLFCAGIVGLGIFNGAALFYRFAAAESATPDFRGKAISLVLAGGVVAGVLGPELAKWSKDWFLPYAFAGVYVAIAVNAILSVPLLYSTDLPRPTIEEWRERGRPLLVIARDARFLVAVLLGVAAYAIMALLMTVTPLAMVACGQSFENAAFVVQWHVVGMYGPAFFTGHVVHRFGTYNTVLAGALMFAGAIAFAVTGIDLINFWGSMFLLGVGWAFMFVGATTLVTEVHTAPERAKTQALNDMIVFGSVALSSFTAAPVLKDLGWNTLNYMTLPVLAAAVLATLWLKTRPARVATA